ncbi:unnamed protein product [Lota lota]
MLRNTVVTVLNSSSAIRPSSDQSQCPSAPAPKCCDWGSKRSGQRLTAVRPSSSSGSKRRGRNGREKQSVCVMNRGVPTTLCTGHTLPSPPPKAP